MLYIIVFLIFATVLLVLLALLYKDPEKQQTQERMETVLTKPLTPAEKAAIAKKKMESRKTEPSKLLVWLSETVGKSINGFMPATVIEGLENKIIAAGQRNMKVTDLLATKAALAFMAAVVAIFMFSPKGHYFNFAIAGKSLFLAIGMISGAFFLPDLSLSQTIQKRHKEILKSLPFSVDLIKICVEAGLDLEGALARVCVKGKGALVEELERALYEIRMGKERIIALADMAKRINLPDLSAFVTILIQSEKVGMSIGKVLEIQSGEMRIKQSQRAREQVAKTPVIMMIPMVLFILPALFIVILGPAMIQIMTTLTAGGGL